MTTLTADVLTAVPRYGEDTTPHTFLYPPVQTMPLEGGEREWTDVLVTKVRNRQYDTGSVIPQEVQDRFVGRVHGVRRSVSEGNGWFLIPGYHRDSDALPDSSRLGANDRWLVEGTELNPTPTVGHYYRMLADQKALVMYEADGRWAVIEGSAGSPWPYNGDGFFDHLTVAPSAYYEVQYTKDDDLLDLDEEEPSADRQFLDRSRLFDRAVLTDGRVHEVLEFEDGVLYVGYVPDDNSERVVVYFGMKVLGSDDLLPWGTYSNRWGGSGHAPDISGPMPEGIRWAKAVLPAVGTNNHHLGVEHYQQQVATRVEGFDGFNTALNEMADRNDWCNEYEEAVHKHGMRGRDDKEHPAQVRLEATVNATVELEDDSPGSRVDSAFSYDYGVSEVTSVRATATISTTVTFVVDWDADYTNGWDSDMDADDFISSSEVSESLEDQITGASWTLEDWNAESVSESDDQEF